MGLKAEEIEQFETEGFVMSGSRHKRMNAVRIRKENQVTKLSDKTKLNVVSGSRHTRMNAVRIRKQN